MGPLDPTNFKMTHSSPSYVENFLRIAAPTKTTAITIAKIMVASNAPPFATIISAPVMSHLHLIEPSYTKIGAMSTPKMKIMITKVVLLLSNKLKNMLPQTTLKLMLVLTKC
jgi:hypothetical protein